MTHLTMSPIFAELQATFIGEAHRRGLMAWVSSTPPLPAAPPPPVSTDDIFGVIQEELDAPPPTGWDFV